MATVNKQAIAAAFGRAAALYEQHADLQRQVLTSYWQCSHSVNTPTYWTRVVDWLDEPPLAGTSRAGDGLRSRRQCLFRHARRMPQTIIWREISNPCR